MKLAGLSCSRYKKFKDSTVIGITPLTIVIGKNGSGKSVVSRLPVLIAGSMSANVDGILDLNAGGIWHAKSLHDLVHARSALPFSLGATFSDGHLKISFETNLLYVNESKRLAVDRFSAKLNENEIVVAEVADLDQLSHDERQYRIVVGGVEKVEKVAWHGLIPDLSHVFTDVDSHLRKIKAALALPSYLGPFRVEAIGAGRYPHQKVESLGPKGERTLDFLANDKLRRKGEVSAKVREWFVKTMGGGVDTDISGEAPVVQVAAGNLDFKVDFADTGAGFSQCLPVVVQNFAYQSGQLNAPILVVEQPELHLHPAAHGDMADLMMDSVISGAVCVVETHSEQFISRIRRRIAEGKISCEMVSILSVDHIDPGSDEVEPLRAISFNERGEPSAWPRGVFEESLDDLRLLRNAARERGL
ncbi:AAA family ATPase [Xanthomonas campestris]|uniref:AAA family ATPase n=1 Tax=Xanthomonas campestris TaxID=339 RepID=UPI0023EA48B2|nr:hypothetical protein [Xanthomonas campestris]